MDAQTTAFTEKLNTMTFAELKDAAMELYLEKRDISRKLTEMENSSSEMALQYQQMKGERDAALYEVKKLTKVNADLADKNAKLSQMLFGRSSEKTNGIMSQPSSSEVTDPLDEDELPEASDVPDDGKGTESGNGDTGGKGKGGRGGKGKTKANGRNSRRNIFDGMPTRTVFDFDIEELNREYGEGNWRFGPWHLHDTVEHVKGYSYHLKTYSPVISVGLEHTAVTVPWEKALIPWSYVSASLLSFLYNERYGMHTPVYRQEHDPSRFGFHLSRQTACNWMNRCAMDYLKPVYEYMMEILRDQRYQQCDETTYRVIEEDSRVQYMWVHCTSELSEDKMIICFCYDSSRSADHLRKFYAGLDHEIYLTSDSYSAYFTISTESNGLIINCGCNMHSRRRFSNALLLLPAGARTDENRPEVKGITLMGDMYSVNTPLNYAAAEERAVVRDTKVREKMKAFFDFVHETDADDPLLSGEAKDALTYAANHETELCRFLDDPYIPADNGFCERCVKYIALSRKNSLFSYSIKGAHVTAILYSLIATARTHNVDPYYYIKYLLENMPSYVKPGSGKDRSWLEKMMPWSDSYRSYEKEEKESLVWRNAPPDSEKPKTPRKKAPPEGKQPKTPEKEAS